ncbi:MAG: hypothetical protein NVS3B10_03500 [Polyangiales bacterium]
MRQVAFSLVVLALVALGSVTYALRAARSGRARTVRTDEVGGTVFLSKRLIEMGYWAMQPIGRGFVALGFTANTVTWLSLLFAAGAGVAFGSGAFGLGALLTFASVVCDALDGFVARKLGTSSNAGEVFDAAIDRYADFFILGGLAYFYRNDRTVLVVTLAALCGAFMVSYVTAKAEAMGVRAPSGAMRRPERSVYLLAGAVFTPLSRAMLEKPPTFSHAIGLPMVLALGVIALVANVSSVRRFVAMAAAVRARDAGLEPVEHAVPSSEPPHAELEPKRTHSLGEAE